MTDEATEQEGPDPTLSSDAADSTYEPAEQPEENPPLGTASVQKLGKPGSGSQKDAPAPSSTKAPAPTKASS